jgi:phytoene dehydrogenase-like protein
MAGKGLPRLWREEFARFEYGPGVCKVDWALDGPVPWQAAECHAAGTVHLGGTAAEVARSEADVAAGRHPRHPYCIVTQPGVVDGTRAPSRCHTLWAYCHVPSGSTIDMSERIEAQIERFAPGFKDRVLVRASRTSAQVEEHNPNYVGGDINGGAINWRQTLFRPVLRWNPYRTGIPGVYLCSASTAPGGGVHGMCGEGAARTALSDLRTARRR